ncbi:hypothetical protein [Burkholderia sp. BCC0322]|uniref:hypothetical protein n=1 Tax=unclassified Burkholderia TaxID=2613784 RepID=UPI00158F231F|nr:hypothetical protein [Burkholderia sp. BCC0322]
MKKQLVSRHGRVPGCAGVNDFVNENDYYIQTWPATGVPVRIDRCRASMGDAPMAVMLRRGTRSARHARSDNETGMDDQDVAVKGHARPAVNTFVAPRPIRFIQ